MSRKGTISITAVAASLVIVVALLIMSQMSTIENAHSIATPGTQVTLSENASSQILNFSAQGEVALWVNFTASNGSTMYVLNDGQYSAFLTNGTLSSYSFKTQGTVLSFSTFKPIDLSPGSYHVVFHYNKYWASNGNSTTVTIQKAQIGNIVKVI